MIVCGLLNHANKDAGACLMRWNPSSQEPPEWVAISEERLARVKCAYFSPIRSLAYCMDAFGVKDVTEIDHFVMDWAVAKRLINSNPAYRKLETDYIFSKLNVAQEKIVFAESHHLAHAASAFYPSGFEQAAVLVVDGVGSDLETISLYHGHDNELTFLGRSRFYGLGHLYTAVTKHLLGFGTGEEGKTMGLAPFGQQVTQPVLDCRGTYNGLEVEYSRFLDRIPESAIRQPGLIACSDRKKVTEEYYSRIAYDVQEELERAMLHLTRYAAERTGSANLCLAGGVALNCVANGVILRSGLFRNLFVQPAATDTGLPYGLALLGYHQIAKGKHRGKSKVYTGITYPRTQIVSLLKQFDIPYRMVTNRAVAKLLADRNIVGWFTGGSEYGPRALGHRSILADPRDAGMKALLNVKVKHREPFRPFAPSVLLEYAYEYFELTVESPYMLLAARVREEMVGHIPAVVHVDQTARVQTVSQNDCSVYRDLLEKFHELAGVPVLLNTSFNDNGEPIVETPLDALLCFMRTKIDFLVLDGVLVDKVAVNRRAASLVKQLRVHRDRLLRQQYISALERCCRGYRVEEMMRYLQQEEIKGRYHALYKAQDLLEDRLWDWVRGKAKVVVIGDEEHLNLLGNLQPYTLLDIRAVLKTEDHRFAIDTLEIDSIGVADAVLVALYNMAFIVQERVKAIFKGDVFTPYTFTSKRLTRVVMVPEKTNLPNQLNGVEAISNECRRDKDWDAFFSRLTQ